MRPDLQTVKPTKGVYYNCHLFVNVQPTYSPADIMKVIKGRTSRELRQSFEHLSKMPSVWTRSYFVSTAGNVSSETIKRYVENQRTRY
jgi:putative transposase